jgi:hypothetical protein
LQAFQITGLIFIALFLLRHALSSWWVLRTELMKAKFKMRLAAERAKRKDTQALCVGLTWLDLTRLDWA